MKLFFLVLSLGVVACPGLGRAVELPDVCRAALDSVERLTEEQGARDAISAAISAQLGALANATWSKGYCRALSDNFVAKEASRAEGASFSVRSLLSSAVEFEAFRIASFRNSGVAPKRYFGFLDEIGAAGEYEKRLKRVATRAAAMLNAYADRKGLGVTVTPKEIIVTHIAEGAALLLSVNFANVDRVHPVSGVGLDDYRRGFKQYPELVSEIDATFNSRLGIVADNPERPIANAIFGAGPVRWAERLFGVVSMTFEESVLGTSVMYLWEKAITEQKRSEEGRPSLNSLSLDEQYVQTSLVYNSGILFSDARVAQIMNFDTAEYLVELSEKSASKRPKLPVLNLSDADALLARGEALPSQTTSWSAVYHILQRYGAWVALTKYGNYFFSDGQVVAGG